MNLTEFYLPPDYDNPLTPSGRGRTIAAFHLAQGDVAELSAQEMRRDVLTALMSTRAVSYWLDQGLLEKTRKVGRVQLLRLTDAGIRTCANSRAGGGNVSTTPELIALWRGRMKQGGPGYVKKTFPPLPSG